MNAMKHRSPAPSSPRRGQTNTILRVFLASSLPLAAQSQLPPAASGGVDYFKDVKPLLAQNCYSCHGDEAQQAGLRLDLRQNALRGGDYGPVIVPGKSAESKLIRKLVDGDGGEKMPPDGELSPEDIATLRAWIDQGADFRNEVAEEAPPKPIDPKLAALIVAVRSAPRLTVEKLMAASPDLLRARDPANSTLLHHAAGFGTLDTLTWLHRFRRGREGDEPARLDAAPLGDPRRSQGALAAGPRGRRQHQAARGPHAALSGGLAGQRPWDSPAPAPTTGPIRICELPTDGHRSWPRPAAVMWRHFVSCSTREANVNTKDSARRDRADGGGVRRQSTGRPAAARPRRRRSDQDETQRNGAGPSRSPP